MSDSAKVWGGEKIGEIQSHLNLCLDEAQTTSPPCKGSGENFRRNECWDTYSSQDHAATLSTPVSPESLSLRSLTITNEDDIPHKGSAERYSHPSQCGLHQLGETRSYGPSGRNSISYHRQGATYTDRRGSGSFRNQMTRLSPEDQMQQDFLIVRNAMRRLFKNSEVAKWKLSDYIAHRAEMNASNSNRLTRQATQEGAPNLSASIPAETEAFLHRCGLNGNFKEVGNFGRVLGEQTIWCRDWANGKDEVAPWPSIAEMKWEGDDRAKTGVGRFLPLPREEGPQGLTWSQLPVIEQYPMDQVCKVPTMEDVYLPVDYYIEPDHEYLWSKELEQEMDSFLNS